MSPEGVHTKKDAILLLEVFTGRRDGDLGEWDFDDFAYERSDDAAVERCRLRARDELLPVLASEADDRDSRIAELVDQMIAELRHND
jgi:hypothetical protein